MVGGTHANTVVHYRCAVLSFPSTKSQYACKVCLKQWVTVSYRFAWASSKIVGPTTCMVISTDAILSPELCSLPLFTACTATFLV